MQGSKKVKRDWREVKEEGLEGGERRGIGGR